MGLMKRMSGGTAFGLGCAFWVVLAGQVDAQELFVDPTVVQRHAKGGPPKLITPETLLTADPMHQFRHGELEKYEGVEDSVLGAKRPVKVTTRFDGAGDTKTYAGQAAIKGAEGFAMGGYRFEDSGSYEGGNGEEVDAGYRREVRQFVTGWTPSPLASLKLVGIQDDITDEKQPHHSLDVLETDRKVGRAILETRDIFGTGVDFESGFKLIDLSRRADNYSLRTNSGQKMRVAIDRRIWEGQGKASFDMAGWKNALTFTGTHDSHVARRYNVTNADKVNSVRIPDVDRDTLALNLDAEKSFGAEQDRTLKAGIRFEQVSTAPGAADEVPDGGPNPALFNISPRTLYSSYYGTTDLDATDHNLSGRLRYEQLVHPSGLTVYGDASRIVRSADNIEKYHAVTGVTTSRWIGNPQLSAEKHHKFELGAVFEDDAYLDYQRKKPGAGLFQSVRLSGSVYYDRINDFITLDRARGQNGVLLSDGAYVFRNVDANWMAATADLQWNATRNLSGRMNVVWQRAENTTDNRAVYQVAPLEANILVDYHESLGSLGTWNIGSRLRLVADQNRLDDDTATGSGFDEHTGGFGVLDLYAGMQVYDRLSLSAGIDNLFDRDYREYIKGNHVENPGKSTIYAPGRAIWIRLSGNF